MSNQNLPHVVIISAGIAGFFSGRFAQRGSQFISRE